ncbi:MAG: ABC transporter ATP-binding protein [Desulfurococcales archaeon]|nr:ABC transporter ATP-binding protein [Desulfurococcales archaeon]
MDVIVVEDLRKSFDGHEAVRGVSFTVGEGEIYGIIGPNGAGKTTTLRMIAGILRPDTGKVLIQGKEPGEAREKGLIGYLPEDAGVYRHLKGIDFLRFVAGLYAEDENEVDRMVERGVEISGLGEALNKPMGGYSKGMKRRILLAAVLMAKPRVAILDEPTSGLDVYHSVMVRNIIKEYARSGGTVLLSSHNMLEVEYLCDRLMFLHRGRKLGEGTPGELVSRYGGANLEEAFINAIGGDSVEA